MLVEFISPAVLVWSLSPSTIPDTVDIAVTDVWYGVIMMRHDISYILYSSSAVRRGRDFLYMFI